MKATKKQIREIASRITDRISQEICDEISEFMSIGNEEYIYGLYEDVSKEIIRELLKN